MMELRIVDRHPGGIIHQVAFGVGVGEYLAQDWLFTITIETVSAVWIPGADNVVPGRNQRNSVAYRFDDTRSLMTEHDWQRVREGSLDHFEIRMAQATCVETDQNITGFGVDDLDFFDHQWCPMLMKYRCSKFHRVNLRLAGLFSCGPHGANRLLSVQYFF